MPFVKRVCHPISTLVVVVVDRSLSLTPYAHLTPLVPKFRVFCMKSFRTAILSWMLFVANN